jgi:hypothetical protein
METDATERPATCRHIGVHLAWVDDVVGYACRACMLAGGATEAELTRRFLDPLGAPGRRRPRAPAVADPAEDGE